MRTWVLMAITTMAVAGQTKNFDTYSYTIPAGYSEKTLPAAIQLNRIDAQQRYACQLALFRSQARLATVEQELEAEWKAIITPEYQLDGPLSTKPLEAAGVPENLARTAPMKVRDMKQLVTTLAAVRYPNRYVGIMLTATPRSNASACYDDFAALIRSVRMSPTPQAAAAPVAPVAPAAGRIPVRPSERGLFPGMPGWLPSGYGVPIPDPAIVDGKPVGLWWQVSGGGGSTEVRVYLPNGVRASNPRLGGPRLYDLESQRQQVGANGTGTFAVGGGQIVERYDGFENRYSFSASRDSFQVGGATFRPLLPVTARSIVGSWKGPGFNFDFREDGTLTYGTDAILNRGRYVVEGYLIYIQPDRSRGWIELIGDTGVFLVRGQALMQRAR